MDNKIILLTLTLAAELKLEGGTNLLNGSFGRNTENRVDGIQGAEFRGIWSTIEPWQSISVANIDFDFLIITSLERLH